MDSTKQSIKQRVGDRYTAAREKARAESAQLYEQQKKEKAELRVVYGPEGRLRDQKKALVKAEENAAKAEAEEINKKNRLAEEFRVFCLKNSYDVKPGTGVFN